MTAATFFGRGLVVLAGLLLVAGAAAAQTPFDNAAKALGAKVTPSDLGASGTLADGASFVERNVFRQQNFSELATFSGAEFQQPTTFSFVSTQSGTVATFTGTYMTGSSGSAVPFTCSVDVATGAFSGNCNGFLGLGGTPTVKSGITATSAGLIRDQADIIVTLIEDRIRDIARDIARGRRTALQGSGAAGSGLSAGGDPARYGAWLDGSGSFLRNTASGKSYNGTSTTGLAGLDAVIGNDWVVGFSVGTTHADLNIDQLNGHRTSNGTIAGPYVSYIVNDAVTIDALVNFTRLTNDVEVGPPPVFHDSFSSGRWTGAINGNYFTSAGPISLTGYGGYTYAYEHAKGFVDPSGALYSTQIARYGALKLGGEASYPIDGFEPYIPFTYEYQTTVPRDGSNRSAIVVGLGLRYAFGEAVKAGILASSTQFHSHIHDDSIAANLRVTF